MAAGGSRHRREISVGRGGGNTPGQLPVMDYLFLLLHCLALPRIQEGGHLPNGYLQAFTPREVSHQERSSFASICS